MPRAGEEALLDRPPAPGGLRGAAGARPAAAAPRAQPPGYYYGMIDGDLVQLAVGTMLVVDAIDGLLN